MSQVAFFYQRQTLDIMIYTFIDTYKFLHPGVSIKEAATAFMSRHSVAEDMYSLKSVVTSYERTSKDYYDAQKERSRGAKEAK